MGVTPHPPAADGERALPEEIASAIEALVNAIGYVASDDGVFLEDMNCDEARSTLTTSILSRLTAAEAGREEAEARVEKLKKALGVAQSALAMLTEPNEIRSTSVANAWAVAVDAELKCRQALTEAQPKGDQ